MDEELRRLERQAAAGDSEARTALDERRRRKGLGWWGEELPPGVVRSAHRQRYRFLDYGEVEMLFLRQGERRVAVIPAIAGYTSGKPPATFDEVYGAALLANGYVWALVDLNPAPTVSDVSLGGHAQWSGRFQQAGGRLGCFGGAWNVSNVIRTLGLIEMFGWGETRDQALERLRD